MDITTDGYINVTESIQKLNQLLQNITVAEIGLEDKMMKANVVASVTGLGENIDISA